MDATRYAVHDEGDVLDQPRLFAEYVCKYPESAFDNLDWEELYENWQNDEPIPVEEDEDGAPLPPLSLEPSLDPNDFGLNVT